MNAARIELKLVLEEAELGAPRLGTFSERFNIQKRVYLIQVIGYDLGYRYGWYLRGPYSRNLTADAFALKEEISSHDKDYESFRLSDDAQQRIGRARSLWSLPPNAGVSNDEWLELLASIHYLRHIAYWPKGSIKNFDAVFKALVEAKPQFAGATAAAQKAWDRLGEFGLIAAKTLA